MTKTKTKTKAKAKPRRKVAPSVTESELLMLVVLMHSRLASLKDCVSAIKAPASVQSFDIALSHQRRLAAAIKEIGDSCNEVQLQILTPMLANYTQALQKTRAQLKRKLKTDMAINDRTNRIAIATATDRADTDRQD